MTNTIEKPKPEQMLPRSDLKRKRGGQPGNLNAYKHGFYSQRFSAGEFSDLSNVLTENLDGEIALLRIIIRRVFEYADSEAATLKDWMMSLSTLATSATRLAGLLRTQHMLTGKKGGNEFLDVIKESIRETAHKKGLY